MSNWTASDIPPQSGRKAVVTGPGGLGFQDALALARARATVIVAGRSPDRGSDAITRIRRSVPYADIRFELLDLADLRSVRHFAARLAAALDGLDLLINNAGVMTPPRRRVTVDGFELQLGTNYLGQFALTAGLLPLLRRGHAARVVTVSSLAARRGAINFDDLQSERHYQPMAAYRQSKLADLMFAFELQRRSDAAGWGLMSIAAHPGIARTDLVSNGPGRHSLRALGRYIVGPIVFQSAAAGALPTLFAATAPTARPGAYYGPSGLFEVRGAPGMAKVPPQARDERAAARLWDVSERLTDVSFSRREELTA